MPYRRRSEEDTGEGNDVVRMQVQLTEEQVEALRAMAASEGVSISELVRRGADMVIGNARAIGRKEQVARAIAIAGQFRSGKSDVSTNHDAYLEEAYDA